MIRFMQETDINRILELEHALFQAPWNREQFLDELINNPFALYYVYEEEGLIIAYVGMWDNGDIAQITTLGVDQKYQNQGLGKKMMLYVIELCLSHHIENLTLEVRVSNAKAIHLYQALGFTIQTTRKQYYTDNYEDAYLMLKKIGDKHEDLRH
ncbi:MAG: ribosomal protein S18-alanine N-acetyltransferase [Erysipelotrichaceae bacterium]